MKLISIFRVRGMQVALRHYTEILDFTMTDPNDTVHSPVIDLGNGYAAFQITTHEGEQLFGSLANVWVEDVGALFNKYKSRRLKIAGKEGSPVEKGPVDQTWGRRELSISEHLSI